MMLRIHQVAGAHAGRVYTFDQAVVRLGRMPDSDVVFDAHADLDASGRHAEIRREGDQWVLYDMGSRNGTFVNGQRTARISLADGALVECGYGGPRVRVELLSAATETKVNPSAATAPQKVVQYSYEDPSEAPQTTSGRPAASAHYVPSGGSPPSSSSRDAAGPGPSSHAVAAEGTAADPTPGAHRLATPQLSMHPRPQSPSYGQRTVSLMIADAQKPLQARELRWKLAAGCLGMFLGVACLAIALVVLWKRAPDAVPDAPRIAAASREAIWSIADAQGVPVCTAFAVRRSLFATSGRCVVAVEQRQQRGQAMTLRAPTGALSIVRMWRHPQMPTDDTLAPADIGLVEVAGEASTLTTLPGREQLAALRENAHLLALGYTDVGVTGVPIELEDAAGGMLHYGDAPIPLGAPLFDASGLVVGVHTGPVPAGGGAGAGAGARIEALLGLLAGLNAAP